MAGSVTSITSSFSFNSRSAASIFALVDSIKASMLALVSFTSCPTRGRSSGSTSFILFNTAVSSPFFPRKATLTSFSLPRPSEFSISRMAFALICSNFSFMMFSFFFYLCAALPRGFYLIGKASTFYFASTSCSYQTKNPSPANPGIGTDIFRGTTHLPGIPGHSHA